MYNSIDKGHKPKYSKCGIEYDLGVGILTKNPSICTEEDLRYYEKKYWIWFEGYWYLCKKNTSKEEIEKGCYCKEHVIEKLIDLI